MEFICFDLDETLISSNKAHIKAYNKAFVKNGLPILDEEKIRKVMIGDTHVSVIKTLFPKINHKKLKNIINDQYKFLLKETGKYAKPIDGAIKILKELKKNYKIGLISNCHHRQIEVLLKGAKIDKKLFDVIVGSDEVAHGKPYPDEILKAEKKLHENVDYMIGDSTYDIRAGRVLGATTICVLTGNTHISKLIKAKPDYIIESIKYVPNIISAE
ncbi:MAG: HAD family hydrolase [Candidatus Woesearchaeota archaeon]|nr:MAG: HAD family hydrolase [Candidatus Woesearchaeota archaeon]